MSTQYETSREIPNEVLANRLEELSNAVVQRMKGNGSIFSNEFTCRIPCELDRDADVVLMEVARRLRGMNRGRD